MKLPPVYQRKLILINLIELLRHCLACRLALRKSVLWHVSFFLVMRFIMRCLFLFLFLFVLELCLLLSAKARAKHTKNDSFSSERGSCPLSLLLQPKPDSLTHTVSQLIIILFSIQVN